MTKLNPESQKINLFALISLDAGIFGWLVTAFILLTSFTPLSSYIHFGPLASRILLALPGTIWIAAIVSGVFASRQAKRQGAQKASGPARWGIALGGIGCALFYGFLLLLGLGFYLLISKGYIGFMAGPFVSL